MRIAALALAALIGVAAGPGVARAQESAQAQPEKPRVEAAEDEAADEEQLSVDAVPTPDARRSYIFFRASRKMGVLFLRQMSAAELEAERAEVVRDSQQRYQAALAEWRQVEEGCRNTPTSRDCRRARPAPEEPNEESLAALLPADRNIAIVYRSPTFSEDGAAFTYLLPVRPGTYILYGQRDAAGTAWDGVCLCMGSVRFDVAPGRIVDLGTVTYPALEAAAARAGADSAFTDGRLPSIALVPPAPGAGLPASLSGLAVVPAELRAAGKLPNLYHLYIDRHPALAGVLGYERDRVIDLGAGSAAPR